MAVTALDVRPGVGALIKDFDAGGAGDIGDYVYIAADGDVEVTDANVALTSAGKGVVVAVGDESGGVTAFVAGDRVSVITFGPVHGFSSLTPGAIQYISETAGEVTETAPSGALTWTQAGGYAQDASTLFVMPGLEAPVSNS